MGKPDIAVKNWLSHKERFADLFNGTVFGGRQVILPEELTIMNSESDFIVVDESNEKHSKGVQRYRDIIMRWKNNTFLMIIACEIQDKVSYAMPVRAMLYDSLSYITQMREIWESLSDEEKKQCNQDEFFSRFRKQDKLYPIVSLVFYYGTNDWDGSRDLFDMFNWDDFTDKDIAMQLIPNYRINLVEPSKINDLSSYKTDLQIIFGMLKCRKDKNELQNFVKSNINFFKSLDLETSQAIAEMLHSNRLMNLTKRKNVEGYDMCKALEDLYNDGVSTGVSKGKAEGKIEDILDLLADYGDVSDDLKKKINEQTDLDILKKWLKLAARVNSIEEFESNM